MPFTLSHPVVAYLFIKAFKKRYLSLTGFIVGTMAPDFEYFIRMKMYGVFGHEFLGIVVFDLPLAIFIALIFHQIIRDPLIENLPHFFNAKFSKFLQMNWFEYFKQHYFIVIISILLGIFTHILWDAFTHKDGYFIEKVNFLRQEISFYDHSIPVFKIFQHLGSSLGLVLIILFICRMSSKSNYRQNVACSKYYYWLVFFTFLFTFMAIWVCVNADILHLLVHVIVAFIACSFYSLLMTSLVFKILVFKIKNNIL